MILVIKILIGFFIMIGIIFSVMIVQSFLEYRRLAKFHKRFFRGIKPE